MTKPQLDLRTLNDVKFWLLSYRFQMSIKLKLNSKLQMFFNLTHIRHIDQGILSVWYDRAKALSQNIEWCQILTPLIPILDVYQTQTQLKIAYVSDQTHIRHIDRGILPVRYDKATAGSENIKQCQILTPLILVSDVDQTQTQLKIANVSDQTHIWHINSH